MKIKTSRRGVLKAALSASVLSIPFTKKANAFENKEYRESGVSGKLIGTGTELVADVDSIQGSVIVDLDIKTGEVKYHDVRDFLSPHSMTDLPGGNYLYISYSNSCPFLDSDFNKTGEIILPDGYLTGGHCALLPDGKRVVTHLNKQTIEKGRTPEDTGLLCIIDIEKKIISKTIPSKILNGHDIIMLRDGTHFAISDDGDLPPAAGSGPPKSPYLIHTYDPAVYIYRVSDFGLENKIPLDINGTFVHIEEGISKTIYGAVEQGVTNTPEGRAILGKRKNPLMIIKFSRNNLHGPIVECNYDNNKIRKSSINKEIQFSPFDIKLNKQSGYIINAYIESHSLARISPNMEKVEFFSTLEYGIEEPFGLANIPGTPYMAVNGFNTGVAIFDTNNMKLVRKFNIETYGMKHMIHVA